MCWKESNAEVKVKSEKLSEQQKQEKTTEKEIINAEEPKVPTSKLAEKLKKAKSDSEDSSSESEGCDGPILDDELAEATSSSGLNVTSVDHNSFLPPSWDDDLIPDTFPSGKRRHHKRNLVLEGSCNYFFWMEKIAMVSEFD